MDFNANTSKQPQIADTEMEDQEVSRNMSRRDEYTEKRSEFMDSFSKDMGLQDQEFMPNLRKDELVLMAECPEQSHSRFDVDENLEVQLRFDLGSLVDAHMLLDTNGPRNSHWDFIRQEQSGLGFQASSEENVSLMVHRVKQDGVKSFDNCEGWPRSSTSQEDAHLFLDAQDDVGMITDAFGAKVRDAEDTDDGEVRERLVSFGQHDEATAWIDVAGKEQLNTKVDIHGEFDDGDVKLHPQLKQNDAVQASSFAVTITEPKTDALDVCEPSKSPGGSNPPSLDNVTDQTQSELALSADMLEVTNEKHEGERSALQTVRKQVVEESTYSQADHRMESTSNTNQTGIEERPPVINELINEFSGETKVLGQLNAIQATDSSPTEVGKIQMHNHVSMENIPCDKNEMSLVETEGFREPQDKGLFEGVHINIVAGECFTEKQFGSERQAEDSHEPLNSGLNASSSQSVSSTVLVGRPSELGVQDSSIAAEDMVPMCTSIGIHSQVNESKIDELEDREVASEEIGGLADQKVDKVIATQDLQEEKMMLEEAVACNEAKGDQAGLSPICESSLDVQSPKDVSDSLVEDTATANVDISVVVPDSARKGLVLAKSLESFESIEAPKVAGAENVKIHDPSGTSHTEKKDMDSLHLGFGLGACENSAGVEKADDINGDTGELTEQKSTSAEMSTVPVNIDCELVPTLSFKHRISDASDVHEDSPPRVEQSGDAVLSEIALPSQDNKNDGKVVCLEWLNDVERRVDSDTFPLQPSQLGGGTEHPPPSALAQSGLEEMAVMQPKGANMTAAAGDNASSNVVIPQNSGIELPVTSSESQETTAKQGLTDIFVAETKKEYAEYNSLEQCAKVKICAGMASVVNNTPPDASDGQTHKGSENGGLLLDTNTSGNMKFVSECSGGQATVANLVIDRSEAVDVDMEDSVMMTRPEEAAKVKVQEKSEKTGQISTDQRPTDDRLGHLELISRETMNQAQEQAKAENPVQENRDQSALQGTVAADASSAEFRKAACEDGVESKELEKSIKVPLNDNGLDGIKMMVPQCIMQSDDITKEVGHLEVVEKGNQFSSPCMSRECKVDDDSNPSATGSTDKTDIIGATSEHENSPPVGGIHLVVQVSHNEIQSGQGYSQISDVLPAGPHLDIQDNFRKENTGSLDGEAASGNPVPNETVPVQVSGVVLDESWLKNQDNHLTKNAVVNGEAVTGDHACNETVLQQNSKCRPEESEIKGPEARIASRGPQTEDKCDATTSRSEKSSEEQVDTGFLLSSVSTPSTIAVRISESATPETKKGSKPRMVSLKETASPINDKQANIGSSVSKKHRGAAMHVTERPQKTRKDLASLKSMDKQRVVTGIKENIGAVQPQVISGQEYPECIQNLSREDAEKRKSDSAIFSTKVSTQTQSRLAGSNEGARGVVGLDPEVGVFSERRKKKDDPILVLQEGKTLMQASDVLGLSQRKGLDFAASALEDSMPSTQVRDKPERCLEMTTDPQVPGKTGGKNLPTHGGPSSHNGVFEGRDAPLLRAASNTVHDNFQIPSIPNKPVLPYNLRQHTALPDLNVAETVPVSSPAQPFSDSQQVQLRAQILVYGSLIQGALPEEALMGAAFSDISGAGRWETVRDSAGARVLWEKSWRMAAERVQNRSFMNTPRDPAQSVGVGNPGLPSVSLTRTSEESIRANVVPQNLGLGAVSSTVDARSLPVLNARFPETSSAKGDPSRLRHSAEAGTGKTGSRSIQSVIMNSSRVPGTPSAIRALPSLIGEGLGTTQSIRSTHVDQQQLPARTVFPTSHIGPFLPGSTHWIPPSPFAGPWLQQPKQAGLDSSVSFPHAQSVVSSDMIHEADTTRRNTSSCRPLVPVSPIVPSFSTSAIGSSPILTSATSDAVPVQRNNAGSIRSPASESRSRKRKKTQSGPVSAGPDVVTPGLSLSSLDTVPGGTSRRTGAPSVPLWSSTNHTIPATSSLPLFATPESLAMVVASTQGLSPLNETSVPTIPANQASIPVFSNALTVQLSNSAAERQIVPIGEHQKRSILSQNVRSHLEEAQAKAEEATSIAACAVRESESMWSELKAQNSSGLVSAETQLVSSAIAMATAASVANAAAAAARVAYEAALQAKMMREEALASIKEANGGHSGDREKAALTSQLADGSDREFSQTGQILKNYKSIMATAKEASKKKLEAASAARMRAQNLDSIVRAAELATLAVSQVGAVVAMGDSVPLTLDVLLDVGPEGLHRLGNMASPGLVLEKERHNKKGSGMKTPNKSPLKEIALESSKKRSVKDGHSVMKEHERAQKSNPSTESDSGVLELPKNGESGGEGKKGETAIARGSKAVTNDSLRIGKQLGVSQKSIIAHHEPRTEHGVPVLGNQIVKDSIVEVLSDEEGLRGVWFSARVLNVEHGKALVVYDELLSDDGPNQLEEWFDLEGAPGEAPRVRLAHPNTSISFEGTRKRRREAMGSHEWAIGDRVDAWIRDGWWEGEIVDILEEGENKVKVFFPGEGDTALIKTPKLRPSLVWRNGEWVLWTDIKQEISRPVESSIIAQKGETPVAKRQKTGKEQPINPDMTKVVIEASSREKVPTPSHREENDRGSAVKLHKDRTDLSVDRKEKLMSAKEGSKVVFGVPKPTKKRKFIEVSKHYAPNRVTRSSPDGKVIEKHEGNKSPALQFSMGSTAASKVDEVKAKKKLPSKQEIRPRKEPESVGTIQTKNAFKDQREKPFPGFGMGLRKDASTLGGSVPGTKNWEAQLVKKKMPSVGVQSDSQRPSGNIPDALQKETTIRKLQIPAERVAMPVDTNILRNDKQASHSLKENDKDKYVAKSGTESLNPRRTNRKIQPTSKLLEGLQSTPKLGKSGSNSSQNKRSAVPLKNTT